MEKIWIVAADKVRARLFQAEHITGPLKEVRNMVNPESRLQDRELVTDDPGRAFTSGDGGRAQTATYSEASEREHQAKLFAKEIVGELDKLRTKGELERVHVLAEPGFMGELREHYPRALQKCVASEIGKRATDRRPEDVRELLPYRM